MLVLAHFSDDNGDNCYPSHATIAKYSGMSKAAVKETIEKLCKAGLLLKQGHSVTGQSDRGRRVQKSRFQEVKIWLAISRIRIPGRGIFVHTREGYLIRLRCLPYRTDQREKEYIPNP
ncbi:helix-turn-helix domain-containing protein [Escherichia coli]